MAEEIARVHPRRRGVIKANWLTSTARGALLAGRMSLIDLRVDGDSAPKYVCGLVIVSRLGLYHLDPLWLR